MASQLRNAYIIGADNFQNWSQGFDTTGYLKVLPHPDQKVAYKDPFKDWQADRPGNYLTSWGPDEELNATLRMEDLDQIKIDGFGILKSGDGIIPWYNNQKTPYDRLRGYNGTIPGPTIITEPGDTLNIQLENYLKDPAQVSNLHTHGLHVSPVGYGDNVLNLLESGDSWPVSIEIPDNHFIGPDWYHPHLHGLTNEQVASGLGGQLLVTTPYDLPDIDKFNPKERPFHFMALNTFGVQQIDRVGKPDDPLNQDPSKPVPAGTPLKVLGTENGEQVYELSDAVYMGYNAKPSLYDPTRPTGGAQGIFSYGGGPLAEPVENVIHTVNGQYNPTLDIKTGDWNVFTFTNMNSNAFHIIQLVKDDGEKLIPQKVTLVAIDGDASGAVASNRRDITELPVLSPGQRLSIQYWFEEPGKYYFLSNGTEELMGENTSTLIKGRSGFEDGHLIWGSQVLASVEVTGDRVPTGPAPEVYDSLIEQAQEIDELVTAARNGEFDRGRTFTWSANLGGALALGRTPDDLDVETFQGTYRINGEYFATDFDESQVPLTMPMLDTTEIWNMRNASGLSDPLLPPELNVPLPEWHPFHIHQNDFTVLEINGIPVSDLKNAYLDGVLSDTIGLPPTYDPDIPPNADNPYGVPKIDGEVSEIKVAIQFEDFPGSYVNHCHILFHEDAGMMAPVRVILNTKDTWLGLASQHNANGQVELYRANNTLQGINLMPYGEAFKGAVDLAIADVNYLHKDSLNKNVTDNVTDIITVQSALDAGQSKFTVKVFDGKTLIEQQEQGRQKFNGEEKELQLSEFNPFQYANLSPDTKASVAAGDINGDGFSDVVVGIGGGIKPLIEVYSGNDYSLLARISPLHHETEFNGTINLASGDVDGDNFEDIIIAQGNGGRGLVEVYSGQLIGRDGSLDGLETAHNTALLTKPFQPYGASFNGEIKLTSGYVLQRPDIPNGAPIQTYHANITTMAVGNVPQGDEAVKVFTFLGGDHHGAAEESGNSQQGGGHQNHSSGGTEGHSSEEEMAPEVRLDVAFTPDGNIEELEGTFADVPGLSQGEPVLFALDSSGKAGLIRLQQQNMPMSIQIGSGPQTSSGDLIYGDSGNNNLMGDQGNDSIYGLGGGDQLNGNQGNDVLTGAEGNDTVRGGKGDDEVFGNQGQDVLFGDLGNDTVRGGKGDDVVFGNQAQDVVFGDLGNDTVYGGQDNDIVFGNQGQDILIGNLGNDTVYGGKDNDLVFGSVGQDVISGDLGNDSLYGGKDNDTLTGGSGDDWLSGDLGNDVLRGEDGSDRFVLASGTGTDTILDFEDGKDLLVLANNLTFGQLTITQGNGATSIAITKTGEVLASLSNVSANLIGSGDFT